jgi:tetratricopeptide (TPR) repeat protein
MSDEKRQEAMEVMGRAYQLHMKGEVDEALELYDRSLEILPTAEAYTFRGWAKSFRRDFEGAIGDCHLAIDLDPEFGNPYNDIGAYHLELGQPEDAIPWLRMALKAKRYESYCFPHYNLGRIFEAAGKLVEAREHFGLALESNPGYAIAAKALRRVEQKLDEGRAAHPSGEPGLP